MQLVTVWFIVLISNNGHRIELPARFDEQKQCAAAAEELERGHPGSRASCVSQQIADPRPEPWKPEPR